MNKVKLAAMHQATERFINKRLRVNKPFQSLINSPQFEEFQKTLKKGISSQFKAVAEVMRNSHMVALMNDSMVESFVKVNMPAMTDYLPKDQLVEYYKFFYIEGVRAQYGRIGLKTTTQKADFSFDGSFDFDLTNPDVIAALEDAAGFLLNQSTGIDATTRDQLIKLIQDVKLGDNATVDEIANALSDEFPDISDARAFTIARTETSRAMGEGNYDAMTNNGVTTKRWVTAGASVCAICEGNSADGFIPIDESFSSGDDYEPAHPNCECYTEAGEINLDSIDIWNGE